MVETEPAARRQPIVFGAPYSVYVRAVRLALEEKGVGYELVPVDVFAPGGPKKSISRGIRSGKIPAFEHAGFRLCEAEAMMRYIDEVFAGPRLQPDDCLRLRPDEANHQHSGQLRVPDAGPAATSSPANEATVAAAA